MRQASLAFQSADRKPIDLLRLKSGQSTSVYLVFSTSDADDALKLGESVEVRLELASSGVSIDPETVTFTPDPTRAKVTLSVSEEDAPAGTFMLQVAEATLIPRFG